MRESGSEKIQSTSAHQRALMKFLNETNKNPDFLKLSPEEQKKMARSYIDKEKAVSINLNEVKREAKE
jgi:hypothetical protein